MCYYCCWHYIIFFLLISIIPHYSQQQTYYTRILQIFLIIQLYSYKYTHIYIIFKKYNYAVFSLFLVQKVFNEILVLNFIYIKRLLVECSEGIAMTESSIVDSSDHTMSDGIPHSIKYSAWAPCNSLFQNVAQECCL